MDIEVQGGNLLLVESNRPFKPYDTHGGTGVGVRLLVEFLREYNQKLHS